MNVIKDPIDEMLKADATSSRDQYIDDDGFTLRVIDNLPALSQISTAMRISIPLGFTFLAATFVALFAGGDIFLVDAVMDIATYSMSKNAFAFAAVVCILIGVSVAAASED